MGGPRQFGRFDDRPAIGLRRLALVAVLTAGVLPAGAHASTFSPASPAAGAVAVGAAPAGTRVEVVLGLRRRQAALDRFADRVADPGSGRYRRFASPAEIDRRFGASEPTRRSVLAYLSRLGIQARIPAPGAFAVATLSTAEAEHLFSTRLDSYRSTDGAHFVAPSSRPRLPGKLRPYVDAVVGLDGSPLAAGPSPLPAPDTGAERRNSGYPARTGSAKGCPEALAQPGFAPNQYRRAYGYLKMARRGLDGSGQRVALISIAKFRPVDVTTFADCFGFQAPPVNVIKIGKAPVPASPSELEATMDVEMVAAAAPGLEAIDVYRAAETRTGLVREFGMPLRSRHPPTVLSTSIAGCEVAFGSGLLHLIEHEIAADSAAGITVLAGAGDTGSSGCRPDGSDPVGLISPFFPASSPHVTGVGGTNIRLDAENRIASEELWNDVPELLLAGGGGPSLAFGRPNYQHGPGMRGPARLTPDVAMLADHDPGYLIFCTSPFCVTGSSPAGGRWVIPGWGTSAATPLLAGGVALANQQAARRGQPPLGALNPLLYRLGRSDAGAGVFDDITIGSNDLGTAIPAAQGGGAPLGCCTARPGYDAASGWGSVDVARLSRAGVLAAAASSVPVR
jgi:subtilase family serine protease